MSASVQVCFTFSSSSALNTPRFIIAIQLQPALNFRMFRFHLYCIRQVDFHILALIETDFTFLILILT